MWLLCKSSSSFYFGFDPLRRVINIIPFFVLPAIMGSHSEQISGIYANFRIVNLPSGRTSQSIGSAIVTHRYVRQYIHSIISAPQIIQAPG